MRKTRPTARRSWCDTVAPYGAILTLAVLLAADAFACPVCYGGASGSMIDGAKLSVIFLGALVYLMIGGGIGMVLLLRRRVRKNLDPRRGLHAVPPERA